MFPDHRAKVFQQVLDPLLLLFERVLQVVALKQNQQRLEIGYYISLCANGVAEPLLARQECGDSIEVVRNIVVTTLAIGPLEQLSPFGIVVAKKLCQLQQFLLELLVTRRDVLLLPIETWLASDFSSRRLLGVGFQSNIFPGRGCLPGVLGRHKNAEDNDLSGQK